MKKVRLAFEGPKQSSKAKPKKDSTVDDNAGENKGKSKSASTALAEDPENTDDKVSFVPTATKKEYVSYLYRMLQRFQCVTPFNAHILSGRSRKGQK